MTQSRLTRDRGKNPCFGRLIPCCAGEKSLLRLAEIRLQAFEVPYLKASGASMEGEKTQKVPDNFPAGREIGAETGST